MPMVMNAQNTAANTDAICVREEADIVKLLVCFAGPFRLYKHCSRERASFNKYN